MKKIAVYAIAKNEEKFVERWYNSMKEADSIYVLDTGSEDNTVDLLRKLGVNVSIKEIVPWRFDIARNESLKLIPDDFDICICTDLDEVFSPGWRRELEKVWTEKLTKLSYNYNWSFDDYGNPAVNFYIGKIHDRHNYKWINPVHEVLKFIGKGEEVTKTTDEITLNHYPDYKKSRASYLPLLELSVKENPDDDRNMHYLGREYMYYGKWNECIDTLIKHINLKNATWRDERSASMRFIARSYKALNRDDEAKMWLNKAIDEAPYLREPYVEMAMLEYSVNNWFLVDDYCYKALRIKKHTKSYINEVFSFDHTIFDLLSISKFYQGDLELSLFYSNKALEISPKDERLIDNNKIISNFFSKNNVSTD